MKRMAFVDLTNFIDWPVGGMLQYELAILPYLAKRFDLDMWGVSVDGKVNSAIELNGKKYPINIFTDVKTKKKIVPNYWRGLLMYRFKQQFREYDYVYVHTGSCAVALAKIINRNNTKLIYHQHGLSHLHDRAIMSLIQRPFVNGAQYLADVVFVVSDNESVREYANSIKNKLKGIMLPIGSPIDLSLFTKNEEKIKSGILNLVYTGRIDSHKSVATLIEMIDEYSKINQNFLLTIVGDGDERQNVEKMVSNLNLGNHVVFTGALPRMQVLEELKRSDIYVTASIGEGVSISVLEAYASGLPVVCFNVLGLARQVVDYHTGRVVPGRDVRQMANAIEEIRLKLNTYSRNSLLEAEKYDAVAISEFIANTIMEG